MLAAGIGAFLLLPLLCPWSAVSDALGRVEPGWIGVALLLVAATYPMATLGLLGADAFPTMLTTSVASSFTGRLLPAYGPQGLAVHQLVKAGTPRAEAVRRLCAARRRRGVARTAVLLILLGLISLLSSHRGRRVARVAVGRAARRRGRARASGSSRPGAGTGTW